MSTAPERVVLHVGCGPREAARLSPVFRGAGWRELRVDADAEVAPDVVGAATDLRGVADASVDAIWSSHDLGRLEARQVPAALAAFRRVLKPDGIALIALPDLHAVARAIVDSGPDAVVTQSRAGRPVTALDLLYGPDRPAAAYRTGFTARTLGRQLLAAGFGTVAVRPGNACDLWAVASPAALRADLGLLERAIATPMGGG